MHNSTDPKEAVKKDSGSPHTSPQGQFSMGKHKGNAKELPTPSTTAADLQLWDTKGPSATN